MKTINFSFYQLPQTISRTNKNGEAYVIEKGFNALYMKTDVHSSLGTKKIVGTIASELFEWASVQQDMGARGIDFSRPIMIKIDCDGLTLDTGSGTSKMYKALQQKLKLQNNDAGRKRFAYKLRRLTEYITREITIVDIDELI